MDPTARHRTPRALVVGAGVAGLAAAASLHRAGWAVVLCERAPARRTGGYFVRLAPEGLAAADRLGVSHTLQTRLPADGVITGVDGRGRTVSRVDASLADDPRALALVRGDLEAALWTARPAEVAVRFGTAPRRVDLRRHGAEVVLDGPDGAVRERYDLVVGADGVRSAVRDMVFGPEEMFRHEFDQVVISAVLPRLPGALREGDYVVPAEVGRTAHLMAVAGHDPVVFFTFRAALLGLGTDSARAAAHAASDPVGTLRHVYGDFAGLMPEILDGVAEAGATHVDTVAQIRLGSWRRGRVVLVGDAAWCPTLYSGQGSALALVGGETLGTHLAAHPDDPEAGLAAWEEAHRPAALAAGSAARRSRHFFLPGNRLVAAVRRAALGVASWRPAGRVLQALAIRATGPGGPGGGSGSGSGGSGTRAGDPPVASAPPGRSDVHPTATSGSRSLPRPALGRP
ncbi:FAD-dependent monooxygenase [Actinomycetospora sp. CA-101289]|uniref:FAD-dependent monooxygenase n=1 Tax=Actinomycetospora sp. CA-101289 TaxID=3239893 RepID=UPI003D966D12